MSPRLVSLTVLCALLACLGILGLPAAAVCPAPEPLTLRINDGTARPGGVLAVVIRTYTPRGVAAGQICFRRAANRGGSPVDGAAATLDPWIERLESAVVFTAANDAVVSASWDPVTGEALLDFESASAGINEEDGPMAVLFFRLRADAPVGTSFDLELDGAATWLRDATGAAIPTEPRPGTFDVLSGGAPYALAADGGEMVIGDWAELGVDSEESRPLSHGTVRFVFDPSWATADWASRVEVVVDPRVGRADTTWSIPAPGEIEVDFDSPNLSLGRIPGRLLTVRVPVAGSTAPASVSAISIAPGASVVDAQGVAPALDLGADTLTAIVPPVLFADGFESGSLVAWCPGAPAGAVIP